MDKLLNDHFSEINRMATRKAVENILERVRLYKQIGFVKKEAKITRNYTPRLHGNTNSIYKSTEEVATWNAQNEQEMKKLIEDVSEALNRLPLKEKEIIEIRYLDNDDIFDYEIYNDLNMSERKYYRMKANAIIKLAIMLEVEIYNDEKIEV